MANLTNHQQKPITVTVWSGSTIFNFFYLFRLYTRSYGFFKCGILTTRTRTSNTSTWKKKTESDLEQQNCVRGFGSEHVSWK